MKKAVQALPLSILLAAHASGQATTIVNNPNDPGVVTSYLSICPTASSTTITLSTTTTICPGPNCGGAPITWYQPRPTSIVGPDGQTTVFEELQFTGPCPCDGGICDAVYTVTRDCPCTAPHPSTMIPAGFVSTAVPCHVCAQNGGPSTVTVVTPVSNGPYASQTPVMGMPYNGASASAAAWAYASAGPNGAVASGGANAAASAGNGNAAASAGSGAGASANNGMSGASSNSSANAQAGNNMMGGSSSSSGPAMPPTVKTFTGSAANRAIFTFSAVAVGVIGSLAIFL